jgi:5-methylcytosine-specific restriction endonuclease McrA
MTSVAVAPERSPPKVAPAKDRIPKALREQVWVTWAGRRFDSPCLVPWCKNVMTVFDFHVGHNIPESKGGVTELSNLRPICARCNLSMGSQYSIEEWGRLSAPVSGRRGWWCCW